MWSFFRADADSRTDSAVALTLFALSSGIFFIGGFLTAIVSLLVPRLKLIYQLDYAQALLVQFASHLSYLLFAVPITLVVVRSGYMRSIAAGLAIMACGCIAIATADFVGSFILVLAALLLLALGITFLQIAANTVVTIVGTSDGSAARLTLLQGFNSLGTVLGPVLAAPLLLAGAGSGAAMTVGVPFLGSAIVLIGLTTAFIVYRDLLDPASRQSAAVILTRLPALLQNPRIVAGMGAMFAYVGAEVTIGTLLTNYLMQREVLGVTPVTAGRLVSLYWAGAMIGRFAGAALLRRIATSRVLTSVALCAAALTMVATLASGVASAVALLAVGLCNSVMYPTIYTLALPSAEELAPLGGMLLCMAVVGGAVLPLLTGVAADAVGLAPALAIPALCYISIAAFAATRWRAR
ncbi:MFS transporter [Polymorphobacter sp. PAMC 29334]|uniref:MFS transporter n=1 Tax=Polymorphobacter sp. PAMC 29334 TaxID=2862331 RepID=UPI001C7414EF|nr:MFS transporter [Polymorphobacter sp. PAMC 29334]QYE35656.1 MFS transporter [Polymorphobacter sp. PAMC 29334]